MKVITSKNRQTWVNEPVTIDWDKDDGRIVIVLQDGTIITATDFYLTYNKDN